MNNDNVKAPKKMLSAAKLDRLAKDVDNSGVYKIKEVVHVALHPRYLANLRLGIIHYFNEQVRRTLYLL